MAEILTKEGAIVLVDESALPTLRRYTWHLDRDGYAARSANGTRYMHREVVKAAPGEIVDHRNGDRLDNRSANLRKTNATGNSANRKPMSSSGFKGVTLHSCGRWQAQIKTGNRGRYLGLFASPEDAARAYDRAALAAWGSSAWLNFPEAA
jgi:hypothetical protein